MPQYKSGDVVILNSGGPKMTVEKGNVDGSKSLCTVWFDSKNELKRSVLLSTTLIHYKNEESEEDIKDGNPT